MRIVHPPLSFGMEIIEDTDTGEWSLQCLCGQMAMYPRRIVLTAEEVAQFRAGTLNTKAIMYDVCHEDPRLADRVVTPFPPDALTYPKP
jgi:hypothetical protein